MEPITLEKSQKPISHGFLLSNGKFITPVEMRVMESLGIIHTTKIWIRKMDQKRAYDKKVKNLPEIIFK